MTKKTYYEKPYETTWSTTVTSVVPYKKKWAILLDETLCYPEGGGQPGDKGMIGDIHIETTIKHDGEIYHIISKKPAVEEGAEVSCSLDWDFRFDFMQQHTGQHILSGVMYRELSIDTVSVHQGEEYTTIEISREEITDEEIAIIERESNRIINRNLEIWCEEKNEDEFDAASLRRAPKVSGRIRLVSIDNCDIVACGGIHTRRTGEVGLISCIGAEPIRGRIRLIFKIGDRAYVDYKEKNAITQELITLYSAKQPEIVNQAKQKSEQVKNLQLQLNSLEKEMALMHLDQAFQTNMTEEKKSVIAIDLTGKPLGILKTISKNLPEDKTYDLCMVQENGNGQLQWLIASMGDDPMDFTEIRSELFPLIGAKGGGRPPVWQGVGTNIDGKSAFLSKFREVSIKS